METFFPLFIYRIVFSKQKTVSIMRIDIEKVRALKREIDQINSQSLDILEIYENGKKIETDKSLIEALEETSLTTFNILTGRFFEKG